MITSFLIALQESFEVVLIIGFFLSSLLKSNHKEFSKYVWIGLLIGILVSFLVAVIFYFIFGGFEGTAKIVFEIVIQLVSSVLLTTIVFEMISGKFMMKNLEQEIEQKVVGSSRKWGLFISTFFSVLNEGIELIIFLSASITDSGSNQLLGALFGIITAIFLGFLFFHGPIHINFKFFFLLMTFFLLYLAALFSYEAIVEVAELSGSSNSDVYGIIGCAAYFIIILGTWIFLRRKKY